MPGQRLPVRQVREVLRLKHVCGHSGHQIAAAFGVSRYTVAENLRRAGVVGITWPVPSELDDAALERRLFSPSFAAGEPARRQPAATDTSQVPVEHWHENIGNPTITDAVLDRLVHGAHRLDLTGDSMRKLRAAKAKLDEAPAQ